MNEVRPQRPRERNVARMVLGIVLLLLGLAAGVFFFRLLDEYLSADATWANEPLLSPEARRFGASLVKQAAFRRMTFFGPISLGFAVAGLVFTVVGARKT
jgi:hypothetical protein